MSEKQENKALTESVEALKKSIPSAIKAYSPVLAPKIKEFLLKLTTKALGSSATKWFGRAILKAVGFTAWPYVYFVNRYGKRLWTKIIYPFLYQWAYRIDKKRVDSANLKEYEDAKKAGATDEELKKLRDDLLNGIRK